MDYFRNLTVNQMIVVLVIVVVLLLGTMVVFNIARQPDMRVVPTATPFRPAGDFQFVLPTATPQP